jgi:hypothetical protein
MSLTRMAAAAFVVMALPLTLGAQPDSSKSAPPPRSPEQLADRYRRAHAAHNVQAIKGLFYWGASTDRTRTLVGSFIEQDVSNAVRQVSVVGLDSSDRFRYTQDGVAFRTSSTAAKETLSPALGSSCIRPACSCMITRSR